MLYSPGSSSLLPSILFSSHLLLLLLLLTDVSWEFVFLLLFLRLASSISQNHFRSTLEMSCYILCLFFQTPTLFWQRLNWFVFNLMWPMLLHTLEYGPMNFRETYSNFVLFLYSIWLLFRLKHRIKKPTFPISFYLVRICACLFEFFAPIFPRPEIRIHWSFLFSFSERYVLRNINIGSDMRSRQSLIIIKKNVCVDSFGLLLYRCV